MSCREGSNSTIVSIVYFLTKSPAGKSREDDVLVRDAFHDLHGKLATEAKETLQNALANPDLLPAERKALQEQKDHAGPRGVPLADPKEVIAWLNDQKAVVRHDPRIPEKKRGGFLAKLDTAVKEVRSGEKVPTIAVFDAWRGLKTRVEEKRAEQDALATVTYLGVTVTKSEVEEAITEFDAAEKALLQAEQIVNAHGYTGESSEQIKFARAAMLTTAVTLDKRLRAYENTDGLDQLAARSVQYQTYAAREQDTIETAKEKLATFREIMKHYRAAKTTNDQTTLARIEPRIQQTGFELARVLLKTKHMKTTLDNESLWEGSPTVWAVVKPDPKTGATRTDLWAAMETYAQLRDLKAVQDGVMNADVKEKRKKARFACRESANKTQPVTQQTA